jgi:cytochrome c
MRTRFRIAIIVLLGSLWSACGSKQETQNEEDYGSPDVGEAVQPSSSDLIEQGASLIKASDCNTCHHVTNKLVGPSHTEVARKYEFTGENIKILADRIIKGGSGVWGQMLMNPHPDVSQADAEKMARYVLSLDGEEEK